MEDNNKKGTIKNRPGLEERIRNTAELLASFAKENLDEKTAEEITKDLADIINNDEDILGY